MLSNETCLTFSELSRELPKIGGKRLNVSTLWRWALRGNRGVKLECLKLGGRYLSSIPAVERFAVSCAERTSSDLATREAERAAQAQSVVVTPPKKLTTAIRRAQIAQANRILDEAGIQ